MDKVDILEIAEKVVIKKQASQTAKSFVSSFVYKLIMFLTDFI